MKNNHSENCKYEDDKGIQYAIWKPKDIGFLIDANEWSYIQNYFDNNVELPELEYDEDKARLVIVYGTYSFQPEREPKSTIEDIERYKGNAHVTLTDNGWVLMELVDVNFFGEFKENDIAIAALIRTTLELPTFKNNDLAMTAFLRYSNLELVDNILNRPGHFEFKDFIECDELCIETWTEHILEDDVMIAHKYFWTCDLEDE